MRVTLSYFVEPSPEEVGSRDLYRYPSHGLRFELNGSGESEADFVHSYQSQGARGRRTPRSRGRQRSLDYWRSAKCWLDSFGHLVRNNRRIGSDQSHWNSPICRMAVRKASSQQIQQADAIFFGKPIFPSWARHRYLYASSGAAWHSSQRDYCDIIICT